MECVCENNDFRLQKTFVMPIFASKFDCRFIGFHTGIAEKTTAQTTFFTEFGSDLFLLFDLEVIRYVDQFANLMLQSLYETRMVVSDCINRNAGKSV